MSVVPARKIKRRNPENAGLRRDETNRIFKKKCPEEHYVAFRAFREDPAANPLKTPSGKNRKLFRASGNPANTAEER